LFMNKNYTTFVIALPQLVHNPEAWSKIHDDIGLIDTFDVRIKNITVKTLLTKMSIPQVAESFGGSPERKVYVLLVEKKSLEPAWLFRACLCFRDLASLLFKFLIQLV